MSGCPRILAVLIVAATAVVAVDADSYGADSYYSVAITNLKLVDGELPAQQTRADWRLRARTQVMVPYAILDGEGEAYTHLSGQAIPARLFEINGGALAVRAPGGKDVTGRLFVANSDWSGMVAVKFVIPAKGASGDARRTFHRAKAAHYERLLARGVPGAAWFRHQARQARTAIGGSLNEIEVNRNRRNRLIRTGEMSDTYALLSGGRAMSENLQLDRVLVVAKDDGRTVELDSLTGITIAEIDWKPLIEGLEPKRDPLASRIPFDQHVVFFPSFAAVVKMSDEARVHGTPVLRLMEPRSEDARTLERYERQMCLTLDAAARLFGSQLVQSVALTGSDPYYRTGTDVAVLFESSTPPMLESILLGRIKEAGRSIDTAEPVQGKIQGVSYQGVRTPDRRLSTYVATFSDTVVVTNSLAQLERLVEVDRGTTESLASLEEFTFFRDRYALGDSEETALLFLSDATIRRWCGPRWRIATSRRTRDMAVLAEMQATQMDRLANGQVSTGPIHTDLPIADDAELTLSPRGVSSSVHGTLDFMTPIIELPIDRVAQVEADAYDRWRSGYQRNWQWAFDPIALRLGVRDERLSADLTVMPLVLRSEYRRLVNIAQGAEIAPGAGDPHDTLAHLVMAVNTKSETFRQAAGFLSLITPGATIGWMGESVAVYIDDDPFWKELASVEPNEREDFLEANFHRMPIAIQAEVSSGLRLTAFLAGFRAFVQQSAPNMVHWESLSYREQGYVRITPTEEGKRGAPAGVDDLAIYYVPSSDSLLVTLNEELLKRSIDRKLARRKAEKEGKPLEQIGRPWIGSSLGVRIDGRTVPMLQRLAGDEYHAIMQARSWGSLPILNEWKRLYPDQDPVALHERVWGTRLVCPGDGRYVWNESHQTMESTVYGHPAKPRRGPSSPPVVDTFLHGNFGLTFEEQGLRTRVSLERKRTTVARP